MIELTAKNKAISSGSKPGVRKSGKVAVAQKRMEKAAAAKKAAPKPPAKQPSDTFDVGDGPEDVANEDEEVNFHAGMNRKARDYEANDADGDGTSTLTSSAPWSARVRRASSRMRSCRCGSMSWTPTAPAKWT